MPVFGVRGFVVEAMRLWEAVRRGVKVGV